MSPKKDIEGRKTVDGVVWRILSCSHAQREPSGGKAGSALQAICTVCDPRTRVAAKAEKAARHRAAAVTMGRYNAPIEPNTVGDKRCAFQPCEAVVDDECWCFGCGIYVCPAHDETGITGPHVREAHTKPVPYVLTGDL